MVQSVPLPLSIPVWECLATVLQRTDISDVFWMSMFRCRVLKKSFLPHVRDVAMKHQRDTSMIDMFMALDEYDFSNINCGALVYNAIVKGHSMSLARVIATGVDPDTKHQGKTPLRQAIQRLDAPCVLVLVAAGANVNKMQFMETSLDMLGHMQRQYHYANANRMHDRAVKQFDAKVDHIRGILKRAGGR
jgi:hypothetical protein